MAEASIKTAGDLRAFLANVMVAIKNGDVDAAEANAISKIAAQINQSLAVEVNTALQLQRLGKDHPVAGSMLISSGDPVLGTTKWCDQCDKSVSGEQIAACKDRFCKARGA